MFEDIDLNAIQEENARELVKRLLNTIEQLSGAVQELRAENQRLRDENNRLKGEQGKRILRGIRSEERHPWITPRSKNGTRGG
jgi:regulator of replication initiation timing